MTAEESCDKSRLCILKAVIPQIGTGAAQHSTTQLDLPLVDDFFPAVAALDPDIGFADDLSQGRLKDYFLVTK